MTVSPGAIGGFGANHHLRQSLVFLDMPVLQQPEAYVGDGFNLFGDDGEIVKEGTEKFFRSFIEALAEWIERTSSK
jgi:chromate reductase